MSTNSRAPAEAATQSDQRVFDYDALCERLNGRRDLVDQLVQMVLSEYREQRERISMRIAVGDANGLIEAAHRLKGQLLTVGVNAAADVARRIEDCGREKRPGSALAVLDELDGEMERFESFIGSQCADGVTQQ